MINCILGLVADAGEAVQEGTQKVLEGMTKAVTDPANAEKATFVNADTVFKGFLLLALLILGSSLALLIFGTNKKSKFWGIVFLILSISLFLILLLKWVGLF